MACVGSCVPRCRSSSADASSIQWTSSKTQQRRRVEHRSSSEPTTPCRRARRNAGRARRTSGVDSTSTSRGAASSGAQGTSSVDRSASSARRARPGCAPRRRCSSTSSSDRMSGRNGWYAVDDSYWSQRRREQLHVGAARRSSSASRDLPIPGSPTSSTSVPKPRRTGATEAPSTARSRSRSTNGTSWASATGSLDGLRTAIAPSATACTGSFFPLTRNGSSSVPSNCVPPARERFGRDPDLVFARARHQPGGECGRVPEHRVRPAERRPDLPREDPSAVRADVHGQRSPRRRPHAAVRSSRSSSSPTVCGAPATSTIRPPSRSTSLSRNVTPCSSAAVWIVRTSASSASAAASAPSVAITSSTPEKRTKAIAALRCSPSSGPTSSSCARSGAGTASSSGSPRHPGAARAHARASGAASRSRPSPFSSPSEPGRALRGSPG